MMLRRRNLMFSVGLENYVQDSLNLWLDGIWNAGKGVHSDTLTSWVDLSGNCRPTPLGTGNRVEENCISSDATIYGRMTVPDVDPINLNTFTLEILFQRNGSETKNQVIIGRNYTKSYYINIYKGELYCWTGGKSNLIYNETGADKYLVQLTYTGSSLNVWLNGERTISNKANTLLTDQIQLDLFGYRGNTTTFDGSIFAVRLHSRVLTDAELAHNFKVDKERFGTTKGILPSGYTLLDYIESTGTQSINTGFAPNQDTRVACDFQFTGTPDAQWLVFGVRDGVNLTDNQYCFGYTNNTTFRSDYYHTRLSYQANAFDTLGRHIVDMNKNITSLDDTLVTHTYEKFSVGNNLLLFGINTGGALWTRTKMRMYSCKIYNNGNLVRDYKPCINPAGEVGMYDIVGKMFYSNTGTGAFIDGPAT